MLNLTLRQLRSLIAIRDTGKISSAANALGLTGPAVTLQLKQIEDELGIALFDRTQEGMRPTAAGLAAIETATIIHEHLRLLGEEIEAIREGGTGSLRLGVVSTAKYFAPKLIATFLRQNPGIRIALKVGNRSETIAGIKDHSLDMALMGRPPRDVPVRSMLFGDHPLVIVAPADHKLASRRDITKEEIASETFLIRERGSGTRTSLEIFFSDIPSKLDEMGIEMDSNETIKQAVMAGLGIAFISAHTIEQELMLGKLVILDVAGLPIRRQWFSVSRLDRNPSPAMKAFEDFLQKEGPRHLPVIPTTYPPEAAATYALPR